MEILNSCKEAIDLCMQNRSFTLAHLYTNEIPKNMDMHIHDNYEINYSVSGGKQFLIDKRFYSVRSGDLFFINQYESHYPAPSGSQPHERIVLSVYPDYLKALSSPDTDLNQCFFLRPAGSGHKLSLSEEEQKRFLYYVHRLSSIQGYGAELLEKAVFLELMVYLNQLFLKNAGKDSAKQYGASQDGYVQTAVDSSRLQVDQILNFIDRNLQSPLTLDLLSQNFYLSSSYLCRIFKSATGTTINKYISAKRISRAKELLSSGYSVGETAELCGYNDYSNFLKTFTKTVGITPKKYAQLSA